MLTLFCVIGGACDPPPTPLPEGEFPEGHLTIPLGEPLSVSGACPPGATFIEARFDGGPWEHVSNCVGGFYDGIFPAQTIPIHGTFDIRDNTAAIFRSVSNVGWGVVIVLAGQSGITQVMETQTMASDLNASVFMTNKETIVESLKHADDPFIESVEKPGEEGGSHWPLFADEYNALVGSSVMFIQHGRGNTAIARWSVGGDLFNRTKSITELALGGSCPNYFFFDNGERDISLAQARGDTPEEFEAYYLGKLLAMADNLNSWCPGLPIGLFRIGGILGLNPHVLALRAAQDEAALTHANIHRIACKDFDGDSDGISDTVFYYVDNLHLSDAARVPMVNRTMSWVSWWEGFTSIPPTDLELGCME